MPEDEKPKRQTRRRRNKMAKGKKSVKKFCESQGCIPNGKPCQCMQLLRFLEEGNEH